MSKLVLIINLKDNNELSRNFYLFDNILVSEYYNCYYDGESFDTDNEFSIDLI